MIVVSVAGENVRESNSLEFIASIDDNLFVLSV